MPEDKIDPMLGVEEDNLKRVAIGGTSVYHCTLCEMQEKEFRVAQKAAMCAHIREHHTGRAYYCELCRWSTG